MKTYKYAVIGYLRYSGIDKRKYFNSTPSAIKYSEKLLKHRGMTQIVIDVFDSPQLVSDLKPEII